MSRTRILISCIVAAVSFMGIVIGTLGTAVLFAVDLPGIASLSPIGRNWFVFACFFVFFVTWIIFFIERMTAVEELSARLKRSRDLQEAIDGLSELRSEGVSKLFAGTPSLNEFEEWEKSFQNWEDRVVEYMKPRFTGAIVGLFSELGAIPAISFSHASKDPAIAKSHEKILRILAKELATLERVIQQGSFLVKEPSPTAWEILFQQQQGG